MGTFILSNLLTNSLTIPYFARGQLALTAVAFAPTDPDHTSIIRPKTVMALIVPSKTRQITPFLRA